MNKKIFKEDKNDIINMFSRFKSYEEIGQVYNTTRQRIFQLIHKWLRKEAIDNIYKQREEFNYKIVKKERNVIKKNTIKIYNKN